MAEGVFQRCEMDLIVIDFTAVQIQLCGSGVKESLGDPLGEKRLSKSPLLFSHSLKCRCFSADPEAAQEVCTLAPKSSHSSGVFPPPWASWCQHNNPKKVPR